MNLTVLGFVLVSVVLYAIVFATNPGNAKHGLELSYRMFVDPRIGLVPLIVSAILLAGLIQAVVPEETITNLLGKEAGLKGIILGSLLGGITPGGPFVSFPMAGAIYKSGAGIGTTLAFISGWSLLAFARIPMEIPFIGPKLVGIRILASLVFPVFIGIVGQWLYEVA